MVTIIEEDAYGDKEALEVSEGSWKVTTKVRRDERETAEEKL